jgi:hypothetical protein
MTYFTTAIDHALTLPRIKDAEFIRMTITNPDMTQQVYSMSTSYKNETITDQNGVSSVATGTFTALGGLVNISGHQRDLTATSYDTQITLVGIDPNQIRKVLEIGLNEGSTSTYHAGIKGAKIQLWRGFYDDSYNLIDTPVLRYTGIVTSYHISEDRQNEIDTFTLTVQCSSYKTVLENRKSGRHTNGASWNKNIYPNYDSNGVPQNPDYDTGMDRVQAIHNTTFNFGLPL